LANQKLFLAFDVVMEGGEAARGLGGRQAAEMAKEIKMMN
jgi:hypothetical protein